MIIGTEISKVCLLLLLRFLVFYCRLGQRAFATLSTFCLLDSTLLCHPRKSQTTEMNLKSCGKVGSPGSSLIPGTCWVAKECSHRTGVLSGILKLRIMT